jgi:hypothetical protein
VVAFLYVLAASIFLIYKTQSRTAYIALFITICAWALFTYGAVLKKRILAIPKIWLLCLPGLLSGFIWLVENPLKKVLLQSWWKLRRNPAVIFYAGVQSWLART